MASYSLEQLKRLGPPIAMSMLLDCIYRSGQPFVTYGEIRDRLQAELNIPNIFPTHIGHVAGALIDLILEKAPAAPLLNTLVTRPNGIPGIGAAGYLAARYRRPVYLNWKKLDRQSKLKVVERVRREVFNAKDLWPKLYEQLFGHKYVLGQPTLSGGESDGLPPQERNWGGCVESEEHRRLKGWVRENPDKIGLKGKFFTAENEVDLLSGDRMDVFFEGDQGVVVVEVKSCRSNDADFTRGIYQCVKYREVKRAELAPLGIKVEAVLVTERELNADLKERAKLLRIKHRMVRVNKS